jgi:general stress protein YciG
MGATKNNDSDNTMTTREAGKLGGDKTKEKGPEFYSEIGSMQGKENNPGNFANRPKEDVKAAAAEGGRNSHNNDGKDSNND